MDGRLLEADHRRRDAILEISSDAGSDLFWIAWRDSISSLLIADEPSLVPEKMLLTLVSDLRHSVGDPRAK